MCIRRHRAFNLPPVMWRAASCRPYLWTRWAPVWGGCGYIAAGLQGRQERALQPGSDVPASLTVAVNADTHRRRADSVRRNTLVECVFSIQVHSVNNYWSQVHTLIVPKILAVLGSVRGEFRRFCAVLLDFGRFQRMCAPKTHLVSRFLHWYGTLCKE